MRLIYMILLAFFLASLYGRAISEVKETSSQKSSPSQYIKVSNSRVATFIGRIEARQLPKIEEEHEFDLVFTPSAKFVFQDPEGDLCNNVVHRRWPINSYEPIARYFEKGEKVFKADVYCNGRGQLLASNIEITGSGGRAVKFPQSRFCEYYRCQPQGSKLTTNIKMQAIISESYKILGQSFFNPLRVDTIKNTKNIEKVVLQWRQDKILSESELIIIRDLLQELYGHSVLPKLVPSNIFLLIHQNCNNIPHNGIRFFTIVEQKGENESFCGYSADGFRYISTYWHVE